MAGIAHDQRGPRIVKRKAEPGSKFPIGRFMIYAGEAKFMLRMRGPNQGQLIQGIDSVN